MPIPRFHLTPASLIACGMAAAALLFVISPIARAAIGTAATPSPVATPTPTPTPLAANIVLDTAAGGPSSRITVTGSSFLAGESMSLYWDTSSHVAASVTADSGGSFTTVVRPFPGDSPGAHRLCASVPPSPCANFTLQGPPTPTPPASPIPSASPVTTPSGSPTDSPSASPVALTVNRWHSGLDVITRPPFVFLPIIGLLALLGALAYWALMRGERTPVLPAASVVHRSARPDMGPGAAPPGAVASPAELTPQIQPPPADLPPPEPLSDTLPPPAPFDPTTEPDAPAGPSEPPESPAY